MVGSVWVGECRGWGGLGSLWGWWCLEVWGLDKVGLRFSSVRLMGQVYGEVGVGEIIRSHVPVVAVAMLESRLASCVHWSRLLDWFVKLGVHGMGQRSAVKEGWSRKGSVRELVSLLCGRNV